ncbi:HAD family hydrolase [Bacillus gobiensis]|uniref:HAD family hydrolase n=1 Tax=Bacillus gobiensis TaxID=1441095 RepID=UPI003D255B75
MFKAVIFDFDGLILDTETAEYEVLQEIFEEHGATLPLSVWGKVVGTISDFHPFTYLQEQAKTKLDLDSFTESRRTRYLKKMESQIERPGVKDYLLAAKDLGLKIGLASSSDYKWVSDYLKSLQLYDFFECIRTADDVEEVKPNPELYLQTAACLGVDPNECLVFEDSVNGLLAAKRAGMKCVIVPNSVTKDLEFGEFDHRLESMAEMELKELIETLR